MSHSFASSTAQQSGTLGNLSCFQLRKFPTLSGIITEWQGFEDLFNSILSHAPDLPNVEKFEYLKTSLQGEALSLVAHLPLTAANYLSAWKILKSRYGNKRDLARINFQSLLKKHVVKSTDSQSIKTLLNSITEHTAALDNLDLVTRSWSPLLLYIFEQHLDYELRSRWELAVGDEHSPSLSEFLDFLSQHMRSAEVCLTSTTSTNLDKFPRNQDKLRSGSAQKILTTVTNQPTNVNCPLCNHSHSIRKCSRFNEKTPNEQFQLAKSHRLCINCLGAGHSSAACSSKYKCQVCNRSHHSLLYFSSNSGPNQQQQTPANVLSTESSTALSMVVRGIPKHVILLSTAILDVVAADGHRHFLRALLDSGSQASFITEQAASLLMLRRFHSPVNITTFASTTSTLVKGKATITVLPCKKLTPSVCVDTLIVPQITGLTPQTPITHETWTHIENLPLADPTYHRPGQIDLLLGADMFPSLVLTGQCRGQTGEPMAMETKFGWVLVGPIQSPPSVSLNSFCISVFETLDKNIKKFWELKEVQTINHLSKKESTAEKFYQQTTTRLVVRTFYG